MEADITDGSGFCAAFPVRFPLDLLQRRLVPRMKA
jgi:hypothetical protein